MAPRLQTGSSISPSIEKKTTKAGAVLSAAMMMPGLVPIKTKRYDGAAPPPPKPKLREDRAPSLEQLAGVNWGDGRGGNHGGSHPNMGEQHRGMVHRPQQKHKSGKPKRASFTLIEDEEVDNIPRVASAGTMPMPTRPTRGSKLNNYGHDHHHQGNDQPHLGNHQLQQGGSSHHHHGSSKSFHHGEKKRHHQPLQRRRSSQHEDVLDQFHQSNPEIKSSKMEKKLKKKSRKKHGDDSSNNSSQPSKAKHSSSDPSLHKSNQYGEEPSNQLPLPPKTHHKKSSKHTQNRSRSNDALREYEELLHQYTNDDGSSSHRSRNHSKSSKSKKKNRSQSNDAVRESMAQGIDDSFKDSISSSNHSNLTESSNGSSASKSSKRSDKSKSGKSRRSKSSDMLREYHELTSKYGGKGDATPSQSKSKKQPRSMSSDMLKELSDIEIGDLDNLLGILPPPSNLDNLDGYDSPRPQFEYARGGGGADSGVANVDDFNMPQKSFSLRMGGSKARSGNSNNNSNSNSNSNNNNNNNNNNHLRHLYPVKKGSSKGSANMDSKDSTRDSMRGRDGRPRKPSPLQARPRRLSPHPVRGFADPSANQQQGNLVKKKSAPSHPSSSNGPHHQAMNHGDSRPSTKYSALSDPSDNDWGDGETLADRTQSPDVSVDSLPVSEPHTSPPGSYNEDRCPSPLDELQRGLDALNLSAQKQHNQHDDVSPDAKASTSDHSVETIHTLNSLDAQKTQTAEQLRDLIEMMQTEFQKLRQSKVNAEMKAQKLETDLISSQQDQDAEFMKLSEENEKWKREASQEKVRREALEMKVEGLERESQTMKNQWARAMKDKVGADERCEALEHENRMLKKMRKNNNNNSKHDGGRRRNCSKDGYQDMSRDTSSHDDGSMASNATSHSVATTSKIGSPSCQGRYSTPPGSPLPFESILKEESSGLQYPQSVHNRRAHHHGGTHKQPQQQAPASWHGGKKNVIRKMPVMLPPFDNSLPSPGNSFRRKTSNSTSSNRKSTASSDGDNTNIITNVRPPGRARNSLTHSVTNCRPLQQSQAPRRESSYSTSSTARSSLTSAFRDSTSASLRDSTLAGSILTENEAVDEDLHEAEGGGEEERDLNTLLDGMVVVMEDGDDSGGDMDGTGAF